MFRLIRKANNFFDDWTGEPERDGVPARPGVMERLSKIESRMDAELQHNHGGSIKDAVKRIDENVKQLAKDFEAHVNSGES